MTGTELPALDSLRFIDSADVYKGDRLAGMLKRTGGGTVEFSYLDAYEGEPIAFSLPLGQVASQPEGALPPFFAGLLPEGHRLTVLNRATKTSMDDDLTMLLAVGADTPGDVRVFPAGSAPSGVPPLLGETEQWDFAALTDLVDRRAVPGVQMKASASMINTPVASRAGHWILKIDPPSYPHLVRNEYLHLQAVRALKIPVARAELATDREGREGLLVARFDRAVDTNGAFVRLALEDASQVLGIPPARKYAVDSEVVVNALAERAQASMVAARALYLQFLFAWLTGNGDLHAKNVSILRGASGVWSVAPVYDIPCTALYRDFTMALPIAGRIKGIRGRHWDEFADSIGIPRRAARSAQRLALTAAEAVDLSQLPFGGSVLKGAQRELRARRAELRSLLG